MEWELSKENYQPLRRGRNPEKLSQAVALPSPAASKSTMEEERRNLWQEIEDYSGPDPLEPWLRLIKWTQEKSGGQQAELLPLLERCTRELQDKDNYKDDIRYLRVWIQYADCLPEPRDVFNFLTENSIGQDLALFYIAYAAYLELRGSFEKAEAVFNAGLQKMALPVQKLRAKHDAFKERMERRRLRKMQDSEPAASAAEESGREALGVIKSKSRAAGLRRAAQLPNQEAVGVRGSVLAPRTGGPSAADKENSAAGEFEVFVDAEFQGSSSGPADHGIGKQRTAGGWEILGSFESTRKENEQWPSKWKGNKFKQNPALMPKPEPRLEIPVDEDLEDVAPKYLDPPEGTLKQRGIAASSLRLQEKLQHDPLSLFKVSGQTAGKQSHKAGAEKPSAVVLTIPELEDISFEEARAQAWLARRAATQQATADVCVKPDMRGTEAATSAAESSTAHASRSPVFNTVHAGRTGPIARPLSGAATAGDVTVATQAAFESINDMFRGALPHDFAWDGAEPTATVRLAEPTVTLSSRAAFDAVNSMFQATLPIDAVSRQARPCSGRLTNVSRKASGSDANDPTGTFHVHEDTDFLPNKGRKSAADQTETFAPYEDTEFLPQRREKQSLGDIYQDTEFLTGRVEGKASRTDQTTDFLVYEDTNLL